MDACYSTSAASPVDGKRTWAEAVSRTYFPLDLQFQPRLRFEGSLQAWDLGSLSLSRNQSDGLLYRRQRRHLRDEREDSFLITIPDRSDISFAQGGHEVRCRPGAFIVQRSDLPYDFSHAEPNGLWVLKVPAATLQARIGLPQRLAAMSFDATRGTGALFVGMIGLLADRLPELGDEARTLAGRHLVDLLAHAIGDDERVLGSRCGSVRTAHLQRAEHFIRANLARRDLSPQSVAGACGISVRYLHQLFKDQGTSVCHFIDAQRLALCDEALRDPACRTSVAEIAYARGFADQAMFSRHYKARYGCTPSETRDRHRARPSVGQRRRG